MGRVHKKKLAQYQKDSENADADEQSVASKDDSGRGEDDREDEDKSAGNNSDADGEEDLTTNANAGGDSKKSASKGDDGEQNSEHEDDTDADGGDSDAEAEEKQSNKNGKRAVKRKPGPKKSQQKNDSDAENDDGDADENGEPIEENGGTPAKRGKKAAGKTKASPPKRGRKTKTPVKNNVENNDEKDEDDGDEVEEEYEVKDVVGHKIEKGVTHYLIRWKGYTKDDDTWESAETLSCQDLIDKYNKKNNVKGGAKPTPVKKVAESNDKRKGKPKSPGNSAKKEEDPDKEWEVDKIIDYAEEKQGQVFRIRWKGYGPKYDTWEPEKNLSCGDLIEKFMKKMNSQKDVSFKELRETPKKTKRLVNETAPRSDPSARKSKRAAGKKR